MSDSFYKQPNRFSSRQNKRKRRSQRIKMICALLFALFAVSFLVFTIQKVRSDFRESGDMQTADAVSSIAPAEIEITGQEEEDTSLFTVCIDAGHGGKDIGCDSKGRIEKDDTLKLAKALSDALSERQIRVVMTRDDDSFLYLSQRCKAAAEANARYLISLHRNKGKGNGAEAWINSRASDETTSLASNILTSLEKVGISRNRGIKQGSYNSNEDDYYITANAEMPACILELGFINDNDDNRMYDANLTDYANAIADAVMTTYECYKDEENCTNTIPSVEPDQNGLQLTNAVIENIEALDGECIGYGQGTNADEENRPVTSVQYEEQYKNYHAHFVNTDAPLTEDGSKKIYLTIDEGYEYGTTASMLDTLQEKGVKATFFVTLPYAQSEPDLIRRMISEGHVIGNHSTTHPSAGLPSQDIETQKSEILQTDAYVREQYDYSMYLFRFPAGKFSEQSLAIVNNCNYESIFWSFAYLDYDVDNQPDQAESLQKMISRLHPGAIYLLHGQSATNAAVLGDFIDQARELGYEFCLIEPDVQ